MPLRFVLDDAEQGHGSGRLDEDDSCEHQVPQSERAFKLHGLTRVSDRRVTMVKAPEAGWEPAAGHGPAYYRNSGPHNGWAVFNAFSHTPCWGAWANHHRSVFGMEGREANIIRSSSQSARQGYMLITSRMGWDPAEQTGRVPIWAT